MQNTHEFKINPRVLEEQIEKSYGFVNLVFRIASFNSKKEDH